MVLQNKWRAARHGMDAELVDPVSQGRVSARKAVTQLVQKLRDTSRALGCEPYLKHVAEMARRKTGADRQISVYRANGDPAEIVRTGIEISDGSLIRT